MRARPALAALVFAALAPVAAAPLTAAPRVWTDLDGRTVEAEFLRAEGDAVVIRRVGDAREFTLLRARLSPADLAELDKLLADAARAAAEPPAWIASLNLALGLPLLSDAELWDDSPAALAARLRLRPESVTPGAESWRTYARPAVPVLGVPAYMLALRSEDGRVAGFSLLFTNRGDHPDFGGGNAGPVGPTALAAFDAELSRDFQKLRSALAAVLPEPETPSTLAQRRAHPGELALFTAGAHEFVLQAWPGQMLALRIQPSERVRPPRLSDERARQRLASRVTRRAHGDVVLDRIPMVDQGPKGYCVPATFERLLRYAGIPADLYELAAVGGTGFGGGTHVAKLVEALDDTIRRAGRRLEVVRIEPAPAALARYLDEGRPVLWSMSSTPEFNLLANLYSTERQTALAVFAAESTTTTTPAAASAETTAKLRAWAADHRRLGETLAAAPDASHLCLLIGYNRATGEVAVSDSWGPEFAERWLPAAAARQVSHGRAWVLDF